MTLTAAQADQVAHLLNTRNQLTVHYTRQRVLQNADNYFIRYDGQQNVIACVEAAKVQWYQTEVKHLTVALEHERQGHASALIDEVEDAVRLQGGKILQCTIREGNTPSRALFTSLGFLPVSKFFSPASGNNVEVLQKILSPPRGG
jgi:ribosomal protein S18 acetylase RimI-like enzyme